MSKEKFRCPRCLSQEMKDYGDILECLDCKLEFDKIDINTIYDKSNILSIQEKRGIAEIFKDYLDSNDFLE